MSKLDNIQMFWNLDQPDVWRLGLKFIKIWKNCSCQENQILNHWTHCVITISIN